MRALWLTAALLIPACGFSAPPQPGSDPEDPYPGGGPMPPSDPTPTARHCTDDPNLRLCLDFDDDTRAGDDGSAGQHDAMCTQVTVMARDQEKAGQLSAQSRMVVSETPDLDITSNLTLSLWAHPDARPKKDQAYWALDNNRQYFVQYLDNGKFRCGIGATTLDAKLAVDAGHWYHVGCTYDQAHGALRIYVNGHVAGCKQTAVAIPTDGAEGLAVGSNIGAGPMGPSFSDAFVGGLDNIEVFSGTMTPDEMCTAASNSDCWQACPLDW